MIEFRSATPADLPRLQSLWRQAFGDEDPFIAQFFETAFAPERSQVALWGGAVCSVLYWFPLLCRGQPMAYLYGVATAQEAQHQGLCTALLRHTHALLERAGAAGILLVPGSKQLISFYRRLDYRPCCPMASLVAARGPDPLPLKRVAPEEYGALRQALLPAGGVRQEGVNLTFQSKLSSLYAGADLLLCAQKQSDGSLLGQELLCRDPEAAAPGVLAALDADAGKFRIPGDQQPPSSRDFAMFLPLHTWRGPAPSYFALAFD